MAVYKLSFGEVTTEGGVTLTPEQISLIEQRVAVRIPHLLQTIINEVLAIPPAPTSGIPLPVTTISAIAAPAPESALNLLGPTGPLDHVQV